MKNYFKHILTSTIVFGLVFNSCKKKENELVPNPVSPSGPNIGSVNSIKTSLLGVVKDNSGSPVIGASVTLGIHSTFTDQDGFFKFENKFVNQRKAYVVVEKNGYFHASRSITPIANSLHKVKIVMLDNNSDGSFNASLGGEVSLTNGAKVEFDANSIVDNQGNSYSDIVNVALEYYDPTAANFFQTTPGDLEAINLNNEKVILASLGMLGVELTGINGESLQIKDGELAEITIPTPYSNAPSNIPLWYFDEQEGIWKEDGEAILQGSEYVGKVSHFTIWNVDFPSESVEMCGKIVDNSGIPLAGVEIIGQDATNGWNYGSVITDSSGNFCFSIAEGAGVSIQLVGECLDVLFSTNIGPFNSSQTLPAIAVNFQPAPGQNMIEGVLTTCNNSLEPALLSVYSGDFNTLINTDYSLNGHYLIDLCTYSGSDIAIVAGIDTLIVTGLTPGVNTLDTLRLNCICDEFSYFRFDVYDTLGVFLFSDSMIGGLHSSYTEVPGLSSFAEVFNNCVEGEESTDYANITFFEDVAPACSFQADVYSSSSQSDFLIYFYSSSGTYAEAYPPSCNASILKGELVSTSIPDIGDYFDGVFSGVCYYTETDGVVNGQVVDIQNGEFHIKRIQ